MTLVESGHVPTIGVGEATFSTVRHFFAYLGLTRQTGFPMLGGVQAGIRFQDWRTPGDHFYHPFERLPSSAVQPGRLVAGAGRPGRRVRPRLLHHHCAVRGEPLPPQLDGSLFAGRSTAWLGKSTLADQRAQFPYAYHFDADAVARYLTGVRHRRAACGT